MAMAKGSEDFDSHIRFGIPRPRWALECDQECAALANKAVGLVERMRSHTEDWQILHAARGGAIKKAMMDLSDSLDEVRHEAKKVQADVDERIAALHFKRAVLHIVPLYWILLVAPIWAELVSQPGWGFMQALFKAIPFLFGVVWAWLDESIQKEFPLLEDKRLTAAWIERATALIPAAVEDTIFPFIPEDSPAASPLNY